MKTSKSILTLLLAFLITSSFLGCSSTRKLQKENSFIIGQVYYQNWVSGIKGGGSGMNLFIPMLTNPKNIVLDSVYFRGKQAKLQLNNDTIFIGRFKNSTNLKPDIIMSNTPYAEYGNQVPEIHKKKPFEQSADECIVSYSIKNKTLYFKITDVIKKESVQYE